MFCTTRVRSLASQVKRAEQEEGLRVVVSQELRAAKLLLNESIIMAVVYYTSLSACLGARIFGRSLLMAPRHAGSSNL